MKTITVLDNFPKTNISITIFFVDIKNYFYTICIVTMATKFKNAGRLHDFVPIETTVVLNNFPKTHIFVLYFINVKRILIQFCLLPWLPN